MRDLNDAIADVETDIGQVQAQLARVATSAGS